MPHRTRKTPHASPPKARRTQIDVAIGVLVEPRPLDGVAGEAQPHVLIARRPHDAVLGGYWEFPGGKIEPGESPAACLAREFHEELGVAIRVGEALPVIEHPYDHGIVRLHPFYCTPARGPSAPQNLAVTEHRWVRPHDLSSYEFPAGNRALIAQIAACYSGSKQ